MAPTVSPSAAAPVETAEPTAETALEKAEKALEAAEPRAGKKERRKFNGNSNSTILIVIVN
jgi:hypothetical protein